MQKLIVLIIFFSPLIQVKAQPESAGVTICGAEFGENKLPGMLNVDYIYPSDSEIHYFAGKGFTRLALPFKWERIQHMPGGKLDSIELREIRSFIRRCDSAKIKVTLVMQNFGRYQSGDKELVLGSKKLTGLQLKDVWKKIADSLSGFTNIYGYDIMNEPHNLKNRYWFQAAQNTIDGIRETDTTVNIIVDGNNYSYSGEWKATNDQLKKLKDPFDKILYDAHCYFDENHSGTYSNKREKIDKNNGTERVLPFIRWLQKNKKKGIIGEFGVPATDKKWLTEMDNFLQCLSSYQIPWNYWAAGQWWKNYPLSIEPVKGADQPQIMILQKYLKVPATAIRPLKFRTY